MGISLERLLPGDGKTFPRKGDIVSIHYTATLEDGSIFDSSYNRGKPFVVEIGTGKVIQGWDEAVPLLSQGEKAILKTPPDLAYGDDGVPPFIPPKSTLTFEMELLEIIRPGVTEPTS
ncbi:peptidyl-prolyl isomerase [Rhodocollybia butyracea]|uniref:peptidylprolyl isomerase n=1 Tax=Rhodocollybia butyracea TaxID=206335 RepID=A0A9P5U9P3_9AGAR|nr:peptidyl-prolyl isomerase [Rhodocollybia butyracea]